MKRKMAIVIITLLMLSFNSIALASGPEAKPSPAIIVADVLLLRPLVLAGTILGGAAFVISLPVTLPFKTTEPVAKHLVIEPLNFTFERPLGKM
jgi:hypothetical protein